MAADLVPPCLSFAFSSSLDLKPRLLPGCCCGCASAKPSEEVWRLLCEASACGAWAGLCHWKEWQGDAFLDGSELQVQNTLEGLGQNTDMFMNLWPVPCGLFGGLATLLRTWGLTQMPQMRERQGT